MSEGEPLELFRFGDFTLHSGRRSRLKIECTALSPNEWHMLARLSLPMLPRFGKVIGVPTGGLIWADILQHYIAPESPLTLFVDDVYTSGASMQSSVTLNSWQKWHGLVLFARGPVPENVTALFTAHKDLE